MVKVGQLIELTDELMEQIVLTFYPERDIYKEDKEGTLRIKEQYGDMRSRIFNILNCNLNEGKVYEVKEK